MSIFPLRDYYKNLSAENKGSYWSLMTNVFVIIITFWIGLSIQNVVATKNSEASLKLAHYDIVNKMYPTYKKIFEWDLMGQLMYIVSSKIKEEDKTSEIKRIITEKEDDLVFYAQLQLDVMGECKYYFYDSNFKDVSNNNGLIMVGIKLLEMINQGHFINEEVVRKSIIELMSSSKYYLTASPNSAVDELADKMALILKNIQANSSLKDGSKTTILIDYILKPLIQNCLLINNEMTFANEKESGFRNINRLFSKESILTLIFAIIIGLFICNLFAKYIAPRNYKVNIDNEIDKLKEKIERQDKAIYVHQGTIYAKENEIDDLIKENKKLNEQIKKFKKGT